MVFSSKNRFEIKDPVADQAADVPAAEEVQEVSELVVLPVAEVQNVPEEVVQTALVVLTLAHLEGRVVHVPAVPVQAQAVVHVY